MWNTAADNKQPYEKKAAKLKEKYEKDIAAYRAKGKPDAAKKGVVKAEKSKKKKEEEDVEARMEKISTATVDLPRALWYRGRKAVQTLQNSSMLKVRNLVSLKTSGRPLARKATEKVPPARKPK